MNLVELKAHAYECLVQIETYQKELQATNQAIANFKEEAPVEAPVNNESPTTPEVPEVEAEKVE